MTWQDAVVTALVAVLALLLSALGGLVAWLFRRLVARVDALERDVAEVRRTADTLKPVADIIKVQGTAYWDTTPGPPRRRRDSK